MKKRAKKMKYHIIQKNSESATILRAVEGATQYIGYIGAASEQQAIELAISEFYADDSFFNDDNSAATNGDGRLIWEKGDNSINEVDYYVIAVTDIELMRDYPQYAEYAEYAN